MLLLALVYLAFVSLGLPDTILGAGWPAMHRALGLPLSAAGAISILVTGCTVAAGLNAVRLLRRWGTYRVVLVSVGATAAALWGFAAAGSLWVLLLLALPLGLGAGAVDTALNDLVARRFAARHMNWLHCSWGVGASIGPLIMASQIQGQGGWRGGYAWVAGLQSLMWLAMVVSAPVWREHDHANDAKGAESRHLSVRQLLALPGFPAAALVFVAYCGVEMGALLWASSYLADYRGLPPATAARWGALTAIGITVGRALSGLLSVWLSNLALIRGGQYLALAGVVLLLFPQPAWLPALALSVLGLGLAPIFPSMLHESPRRFGARNSAAAIGGQMALGYVGAALLPPLYGLLAGAAGLWTLPWWLLPLGLLMAAAAEVCRQQTAEPHPEASY